MIRPALIWCDQRSQRQVDFINTAAGPENVLALHGESGSHRLHAAETAVGARQRTGEYSTRSGTCCCRRTIVRFKLTGEFATDVSDASGTALFDVVNRRWSDEMIDDPAIWTDRYLPEAYESSEVAGHSFRASGARHRASRGTPVVGWRAATRRQARSATES